MKKFYFVILGILCLCLCANAQQKDWAQFGRYAIANAALSQNPVAVLMGDSITDNWASFDAEFFSTNSFAGRGISGQTTAEMLVRFRQDVIDLKPKAVVILAGTNDIAMNNGFISKENMVANIISMCELAKMHNIQVILCSILPSAGFGWRPSVKPAPIIPSVNAMIKEYAKANHIYYLDYYSAMVDDEGGLPKSLSPDNCHPNLEGYRTIMEPMLCEALNKVLKRKKSEKFVPVVSK